MSRRSRISLEAASTPALALLLVSGSISGCARTVVLEDQIADGGATSSLDGPSGDGHCFGNQAQALSFRVQSPEVIVVLDRSSTMNTQLGGGGTQLSAALNALVSEVQSYQSLVRFGFVDFPDALDSCANSCCVSQVMMPPPVVSTMNRAYFENAAYACNANGPGMNGPNGLSCPTANSRPTEVALRSSASYYQGDLQMLGRYVLLVTNGDPGGNCGSSRGDCADAEDQVSTLSGLNVQTVVVDLGAQANPGDCLHDVAAQQGNSGAPYYYFPGANGLNDDLKTITGTIAADACHLVLTTPADDTSQVSIVYGGTPIPHESGDGWTFDPHSSTNITLNGASCQMFISNRNLQQGLEVLYGCPTGHGGSSTP